MYPFPHFMFQEELIKYQHNFTQLLKIPYLKKVKGKKNADNKEI